MKKTLFVFCPFFIGAFSIMLINRNSGVSIVAPTQNSMPPDVISCSPSAGEVFVNDANGKFIRLMPGWGNHSYTISTSVDSAQVYFNQGLSMHFSYHMREAIASFKEAARFDTSCAMAYWGQALSMGPTYNFGYNYKMNAAIPTVLLAMNRHAGNASQKEKDLISAMNRRYRVEDVADTQRKQLNIGYVEAMKPLVNRYPEDLDIKALYTDAVMLVHPWEFWNNDGTAKPWTAELVEYCQDILLKDPHHPGALHYYIHVTEASRNPEIALASADSLIKLFPGVAHMVHMSSHEYERIGYYAKGVLANEKADQSLITYDSLAKGLFSQVHVPHYFAVEAYCALSGAMYQKGIEKSLKLRHSVQPNAEGHYLQYQYMYPELARVRLGKWKDILQDTTTVPASWSFATILDQFSKGMAGAKTGNLTKAEQHLQSLRAAKKDESLITRFAPHASSPFECATVAEYILLANIRFQQKKERETLSAIQKAILAEDSLLYSEPKMWLIPARQYLGAFLLQLSRPREAEHVYREDLRWNPGNGWSLIGLYQALQAQKKTSELAKLKKAYTASFSEAEQIPVRSAY